MPVATPSAFFEVLEKSRLLPAEQLESLRESLADVPDGKAAAVRLVKEGVLTRWQAGALLSGSANLTIGKYHLLSQLGSGKTGRVFLARHAEMGRQVAIKILPRRADASSNNLQQFQEQARAVSSLDHPNLIHTYDVDSEADQFYLVMEHFPGGDLAAVVEKEGPLEFSRAADIVRQGAEGLAHAAEKGMTHGDIRPDSIAVDHAGRVKILHLGMVELAGVEMRTLNKKDPATADYAAPEFTGGNATAASDLYSLGCVLYFLLTGKPPFGEGDFAARRRQHQSVPPAAVAAARPETPADLAKLCQKMMAKKPENRPESAQAVAAALAAWLADNPLPQARAGSKSDADLRTAAPLPGGEKKVPPHTGAAATAAAADAPAPNFNFDSPKPPVKRSETTPAVSDTAAEGAAPAKKKMAKGAKKPLDRRLVIGLAAGGGIALLALLAVGAFFAFGGGEPEQVAEATADAAAESESEVLDGAVLDEETLEGDLFSSSDDEAPAEAADSAFAAATDDSDSDELLASAAPVEEADAAAEPTEPEPAVEAASGAEAQPPAPSETTSEAPAEPEPEPSASAASETPAESPLPKEAPKPAEKKPEAKPEPEPKPKPKEPFADFAQSAVSLPPLETEEGAAASLQPVSLGKVYDDPEAGVFVRLVGGDTAHDGREVFTLEQDDPSFRNRAWTVNLGEEAPVTVARLSLDDQDNLMFQWTPESAEQKDANYLRNCMLNIQIGDKIKDAVLREPEIVEPISVSLSKPSPRPPQIDLAYPPAEENLQVEITELEGPFPNHTFAPQNTIKASRDTAQILFGDPPTQLLVLQVQTSMSRGRLGIALTPFINMGGRPVRLKPGALEQAAATYQAQYQQANNLVTAKAGPEQLRKQMEQNLPVLQAMASQYADLAQKAGQIDASGKIHFRVFFTVGQHQVDIIKTNAPAPAAKEQP
ncbi:MAG: serine/threonine protein kinase [Planctomycetes bacterium]|nr:serine/threonine protein kinase [Planctomycetota bacterium]